MDAVENCLRAIENYNIDKATRTGKPNAFAYFTQISWYAFLRRIAKEKKQQDIKFKYMAQAGVDDFVDMGENHDGHAEAVTGHFIDVLKDRIDKVKVHDHAIKTFSDSQRKKKRKRTADSDLQEFLG